jgi:transcriptional regulator with XRE-family HTH domain
LRAFLRWSVTDLARKAGVGISTVRRIEAAEGIPEISEDLEWRAVARSAVVKAVRDALVEAGITFLPEDGRGVGIRGKAKKSRRKSV